MTLATAVRRSIAAATVLAALAVAGGCARATPVVSAPPTSNVTTSAVSPPSATPGGGVELTRLKLRLEPAWSGFAQPVYLTNSGDGSGRLLVVEQGGLIKVISGGAVVARPYLDVSKAISTGGERGQNWGWNVWEGTHPYRAGATPPRSGFTFPVAEYPHPQGESVTGGYVYRGARQPALVGTCLYADFVKGWIGGVRLDSPDGTPRAVPENQVLLKTSTKPSSFGVDQDNELYLVDYTGAVWTVVASAK